MKINTRHILFALMMLIAAAPFLLPGMLVFQKALIVHEMREKLEHEELQEIRIERQDIRWIKPGKELWVGFRMFDVKEIKEDGQTVILRGLYDDKEKEIIARMSSLTAPLPFEKERCSAIYKITHLETFISPQREEFVREQPLQKFPDLILTFNAGVQPSPFIPPDSI